MRLVAIGIVHLNGFLVALSLLPLRRSRRGATAPPFVALVFEIALIVVVGRVLQVILVIEIALAICPGVGSSARVHRSVTTVGPVERAHAKGRGGCATVYIGGKHRIHVEFAETHLSSPMLLRGRPAPSAILWLKSVALIDALFGLL